MVNLQEVEEQFTVNNPQQLDYLVPKIIELAADHSIWLFNGDLGAGKTTLIQAICRAKGVVDRVTSPTFSLLHEYHTTQEEIIYHFDFYRLHKESEALDIGCNEYFDSGNICLIEWPNKVRSMLPEKNLEINLLVQSNDHRLIKVRRNV